MGMMGFRIARERMAAQASKKDLADKSVDELFRIASILKIATKGGENKKQLLSLINAEKKKENEAIKKAVKSVDKKNVIIEKRPPLKKMKLDKLLDYAEGLGIKCQDKRRKLIEKEVAKAEKKIKKGKKK